MQLRRKLSQLTQTYTHVRLLKADGNDFYRAVAFAMIESAVKSRHPRHIRDVIERCIPLAKSVTNGLAALMSLQDWEALLCGVKCKQDTDSLRDLIEATFVDSKVFDEVCVGAHDCCLHDLCSIPVVVCCLRAW
jgi:Peptidase C65 Otubain